MSRATSVIHDARVLAVLGEIAAKLDVIIVALQDDATSGSTAPGANGDEMLGPGKVAAMLGVDARTLRRMRAGNAAPKSVSINNRPRWRRSTVEAWLAARGAR